MPVDLEPLGDAESYGADRVFVRIALTDGTAGARTALTTALADAGHPVIRITVNDPIDLGAEFVRWEVATAIAGAVLGIDPFDQPNVEEAKQLTRTVLARHEAGQPTDAGPAPLLVGDGTGDVVAALTTHLARRREDAYLCLQAFIAPSAETDAAIARMRAMLRDATGRATTAGYGPRFLHSTGQLHKGGTPSGWFLQLTSDHPADRPIPGWPYTFGQLIDGQAAGDLAAIEAHGLPILRVHLGSDIAAGLAALERAIAAALDSAATPSVTEA